MSAQAKNLAEETFYVLGETLAPMLTNDMARPSRYSAPPVLPVAARRPTDMPGRRSTL